MGFALNFILVNVFKMPTVLLPFHQFLHALITVNNITQAAMSEIFCVELISERILDGMNNSNFTVNGPHHLSAINCLSCPCFTIDHADRLVCLISRTGMIFSKSIHI